MSALGRRVGMSAPAVTERVQRMQRAGVITGFRMEVDPAALGLPVAAFVRIRPTAGQLDKIAALAGAIGQVSECHRITGEDCFLVKVHAARDRRSWRRCSTGSCCTGRRSARSWCPHRCRRDRCRCRARRRQPASRCASDQLTVPVATVRALVDAQFPAWRGLPVRRVAAHGTVKRDAGAASRAVRRARRAGR